MLETEYRSKHEDKLCLDSTGQNTPRLESLSNDSGALFAALYSRTIWRKLAKPSDAILDQYSTHCVEVSPYGQEPSWSSCSHSESLPEYWGGKKTGVTLNNFQN